MKKIALVILALTLVVSCKNKDKKAEELKDNTFKITITGGEHFPEGARVSFGRQGLEESAEYFERLNEGSFVNNTFEYTGTVDDPHFITYDILSPDTGYPLNRLTLVLEPGQTTINYTSQKDFELEGGPLNKLAVNSWNEDQGYIDAAKAYLEYAKTAQVKKGEQYKEEQLKLIMEKIVAVNHAKEDALDKVFKKSNDDFSKLMIYNSGYLGSKENTIETEEKRENIMEQLALGFSNSRVAKLTLKNIKNSRASRMASAQVGVGSVIKDFEAKNLKGETFHLANVLKENKHVLVEFWASWCGPCRGEIPHMKKAYSHYKDKGFEIVSFTLDHKEEAWKKASKEEQIPWIDTGDLLAMTSPVVKMYGVGGVSANYLVEASTGKIIARDLRQEKLDEKLVELLD